MKRPGEELASRPLYFHRGSDLEQFAGNLWYVGNFISLRDIMTTEAEIAKKYYLFSKKYDTKTVCQLMETNLRGEV